MLFIIVATADVLAFGGRGRIALTHELQHAGWVIAHQDWRGFL